jgi:hypothetical protein
MPDNAIVEMLLIKGSSDRWSSHHLVQARHKQASMPAAEFQRLLHRNLMGRKRDSGLCSDDIAQWKPMKLQPVAFTIFDDA